MHRRHSQAVAGVSSAARLESSTRCQHKGAALIKSTLKHGLNVTSFRLVVGFFALIAVAVAQDNSDPVLDYYWSGAGSRLQETSPIKAEVTYTLSTRTFIHKVNSSGEIVKTDTLVAEFDYHDGQYVSRVEADSLQPLADRVDLTYPNVFDGDYHLNFFPNDTGGEELAIGLRADSAVSGWPDGLVYIDRDNKRLLRMYLHYPGREGFKRFSRSFRFVEKDGYVFPDSVWEVAVESGFIASDVWRIETGITDITIKP